MAPLVDLAVVLIIMLGVVVVVWGTRRTEQRRHLGRQLDRAQALINTLHMDAAQHVALGDNFAQIVLDEINTYMNNERRELR